MLPGNINDIIHFNLSNRETDPFVRGDYTPDISIDNDTFYFDFLVVNWNDTTNKGTCYQIYDPLSASLNYNGSGYDWESYYRSLEILSVNEYNESLGIGEFDEIRVGLPVFGFFGIPLNNTACPEYIGWQYVISDRKSIYFLYEGEVPTQTAIACNIKIVR